MVETVYLDEATTPPAAAASNGNGTDINLTAGDGDGTGDGGGFFVNAGAAPGAGNGGDAELFGGQSTDGTGGTVVISGGVSSNDQGGDATLRGGSGVTAGGDVFITGGAISGPSGNGGKIQISPGTASGGGKNGILRVLGAVLIRQLTPTAKTQGATLTATELLSKIITTDAADDAADNYQLPTVSDLETEIPDAATNDAFDISVINIGTNANEDVTITTNTGWTLVGEMTVESNDGDNARSSGLFRARKTGGGAWTLYRIA